MTTNAVNYKIGADQNKIRKFEADIKKFEAELKEAGIELDRDKLIEAIRSNKVNEFLRQSELDETKWKNKMDTLVKAGSALLGKGGVGSLLSLNDESWHNKITDTYDQSTNLSFSRKGGQPIKAGWSESRYPATNVNPTSNDFVHMDTSRDVANGGIALIHYYPVFSIQSLSLEAGETQNVVRTIWNKVRSSNSGYVNGYDQSDLFQYVFCSSSLAEILAVVLRPFNYMDAKRKSGNNYMSNDYVLIDLMTGNNANTIVEQKTSFIQVINSKLRSVNAQKLPIGFDLTKRRLVLNRNIFTHSHNKDEMYVFLPSIAYKYVEADGKCQAVEINYQDIFSSPTKLGQFLETLISPLINGNASSIMAGDIKKAYPKNVATLASLKYQLKGDIYSEDEHILEAIRNANIVPTMPKTDINQFDIKQGINVNQDTYIYAGTLNASNEMEYKFINTKTADGNDHYGTEFLNIITINGGETRSYYPTNYLDVKVDNVSKYDIMAGTRFKVNRRVDIFRDNDDVIFSSTIVYGCGTEMIHQIEFCNFESAAKFSQVEISKILASDYYENEFLNCTREEAVQYGLSLINFRYAPYVPELTIITEAEDFWTMAGGRGNYNLRNITNWELDQLNIASFGSLLMTNDDKINNSDIE